jgi:DNA-binding transcriptional MerR regulator
MNSKLFLNNEVSKITCLSQRQVISWTEKGLIKPERPAMKAGTMRGYSYKNLLELGLVKYLMDVIGVQFFTAKTILEDLRADGTIEVWASNYSAYLLSFADKITDKNNKIISDSDIKFADRDPRGIGGTVESIPKNLPKPKAEDGTLYYIFSDFGSEKGYKTVIRIISPWKLSQTIEAFKHQGNYEEIINSNGMIIVNMGKIKREIDKGIESLG